MRMAVLTILFVLFLASAVNAQMITNQCKVDGVDVSNKVDEDVHVELLYKFSCTNATAYIGQMTKMLITIPYTDINDLEAEDPFGSMNVVEGPAYVGVTKEDDESTIGVIFRKGLLISSEGGAYSVKIEFDTDSLVKKEESTNILKPGDLVSNPKITIVSMGITETTIPVPIINYELELPDGSNIEQVSPSVCGINENEISCFGLGKDAFDNVEVKWTKKFSIEDWGDKLKDYTTDFLPKISETFNSFKNKISDWFKKE